MSDIVFGRLQVRNSIWKVKCPISYLEGYRFGIVFGKLHVRYCIWKVTGPV